MLADGTPITVPPIRVWRWRPEVSANFSIGSIDTARPRDQAITLDCRRAEIAAPF
jgi:hypothetical protein